MENIDYLNQLDQELVVAIGCTEPVAVAYAAALAKKQAGPGAIKKLDVIASINIYKNAMGVNIPGTQEMGVAMAAALGAIAGNADQGLEVLSNVTEGNIAEAKALCENGKVTLETYDGEQPLYIDVKLRTDHHSGRAIIEHKHDLIILLEKDSVTIFQNEPTLSTELKDSITADNISSIYDFALNVDLSKLDKIRRAVELNGKVADEGLKNEYGLSVSHALQGPCDLKDFNLEIYCAVKTAAATDARMAGAPLPVMSNSGSGNQGLTVTIPVLAAAEWLNADEETHMRAQTLSQLIAVHVKSSFGRLSPLCGAVAAGVGASCGIVYLLGGKLPECIAAVQNMFGTITGMICDGAKAGCALKVSTCVFAAVQAAKVAMAGRSIQSTDGVIEEDVEATIRNMERISKEGMADMDRLLLNIMLNK
ncbi:MAG TPA: serine dehydratase subunit alpha family protein [Clostridiaceae bacterium]|nr:serine dehydratase subunit alpha family protein [Clostridiaceae bacterium]